MAIKVELKISQLKVFSSFFTNLAAAWFFALFATHDPLVLTMDLVFGTLSLHLALRAQAEIL